MISEEININLNRLSTESFRPHRRSYDSPLFYLKVLVSAIFTECDCG